MGIGSDVSNLTGVTSTFPKWIISDKRLPASPQNESSRTKGCQQPLGHTSAAPSCSSCLKVKLQPGKHKAILWFLPSSHKIGEHSSLQCKIRTSLQLNTKDTAKALKPNSLGRSNPISIGAEDKPRLHSDDGLAQQTPNPNLAYTAKPD